MKYNAGDEVRVDSFIGKIVNIELGTDGIVRYVVTDDIRRCYNLTENNISELELPPEEIMLDNKHEA